MWDCYSQRPIWFRIGLGFVFSIIVSIFLGFSFISLIVCSWMAMASWLNVFFSKLFGGIHSVLQGNSSFWVIYVLFNLLFFFNLSGNIPLNTIPTLFYSQTLTISLIFWVPIIVCVYASQLNNFIAHILPYGSPVGLMLFLPLVEIFSQIIRPITLMIRLSTNLSSGHIIIYMFSYFTLLSDALSPFIVPVIFILYILEICISALQAYIFVTLIRLYVVDTV
jgi:ATP synthase subunit 6